MSKTQLIKPFFQFKLKGDQKKLLKKRSTRRWLKNLARIAHSNIHEDKLKNETERCYMEIMLFGETSFNPSKVTK